VIALLLACSAPDRTAWLLDEDHWPLTGDNRREAMDILRYDPDRARRSLALKAINVGRSGQDVVRGYGDPELLAPLYESWVRFDADPAWAWACDDAFRLGCTITWQCEDEGDVRQCLPDAPAVCQVYDPVRPGCFRGQGPCVQSRTRVLDAGPGSPAAKHDDPNQVAMPEDLGDLRNPAPPRPFLPGL
jgi:hypothetical protein